MTEGVELANQVKIRTLGEKETYEYLGILIVNSTKRLDIKEKKEIENISGE